MRINPVAAKSESWGTYFGAALSFLLILSFFFSFFFHFSFSLMRDIGERWSWAASAVRLQGGWLGW
jgi:hypothetical protein